MLHCSLQAPSGKMFVSAREEGNSPSTQCMGLLLGRYVPRQALASPDWRGLPNEAEALEGMFTTYITSPLCAAAVPSQVCRLTFLSKYLKSIQRERVISMLLF